MELVRYPPGAFSRRPILFSGAFAIMCICFAAALVTFWMTNEIKRQRSERAQMEDRLQFDSAQIRALTRRVESLSARSSGPADFVFPHSPQPQARVTTVRQQLVEPTPAPPVVINGKVTSEEQPTPAPQGSAPANYDSDLQELHSSVATTHEELLKLERQGSRHFFEFKLDKKKDFQDVGGLQVQLRKVDQKHNSYNISILVSGHRLDKSKINLFEPIWIASADNPMKYQLVVNGIAQNQITGYVSEAKTAANYSKR